MVGYLSTLDSVVIKSQLQPCAMLVAALMRPQVGLGLCCVCDLVTSHTAYFHHISDRGTDIGLFLCTISHGRLAGIRQQRHKQQHAEETYDLVCCV